MAIKKYNLLVALAFTGCAVFEPVEDLSTGEDRTQGSDFAVEEPPRNIELAQSPNDGSSLASSMDFKNQFRQNFQQQKDLATIAELKQILLQKNNQNSTTTYKQHDINYYVRGLMQDLVANLQYVNASTPVAVVSFVMLDSDYNDANLLGIQLAESLIHEVHKFGIPVIDFKTTGFIRVTEQGDFAFSKDYEDFSGEMSAQYIVGGTMLKHTDGYLINARIVGVESQVVVASAQSFIPNNVSDPILMTSAVPTSQISNETVESRNVAFPVVKDSAFSITNNTANLPLGNSVSLIQE